MLMKFTYKTTQVRCIISLLPHSYKLSFLVIDLCAPLFELLGHFLHALLESTAFVQLILPGILLQLPRNLHAAEFGPAHAAEVSHLQGIESM